ncbi:YqzL family protein [Paenibacillus polymyxa]
MRDFSWKYFVMTGDVGAYLLYRESAVTREQDTDEGESDEHEEARE